MVGSWYTKKNKGNKSSQLAWVVLTGMSLDVGKVKEARNTEVEYVTEKAVYTNIPRLTVVQKQMGIL